MARLLAKLARDRRGGAAIEYGLIVALVVIVIISAIRGVGDSNSGGWGAIANKVAAVTPSA
jgi:pilus assembly protein Flp/PilA